MDLLFLYIDLVLIFALRAFSLQFSGNVQLLF